MVLQRTTPPHCRLLVIMVVMFTFDLKNLHWLVSKFWLMVVCLAFDMWLFSDLLRYTLFKDVWVATTALMVMLCFVTSSPPSWELLVWIGFIVLSHGLFLSRFIWLEKFVYVSCDFSQEIFVTWIDGRWFIHHYLCMRKFTQFVFCYLLSFTPLLL